MIFNDTENTSVETPSEDGIKDVFVNIFSSTSPEDNMPSNLKSEEIIDLWNPIKIDEMDSSIKSMKTRAPGPDGFTVPDFKAMDTFARNFFLNYSLHTGKMLDYHTA